MSWSSFGIQLSYLSKAILAGRLQCKNIGMPPGPSHTPQAKERTALQRMSLTQGKRPEQLPAGKRLMASMAAKGWIAKQPDGRTYRITRLALRS
jgi:hypothetical protein